MTQQQLNLLEKEFGKWMNHEQHIIRAFKNCKCSVKQQQELRKSLENKIAHLNQTKWNITQEVMFEIYNKFTMTNSILQLSELSDQVNISWNDNQEGLEKCGIFKEKNKQVLENMKARSHQKLIARKNILKSQSDVIGNIKSDVISLCKNKERDPFGLGTLKEMKKKCMDDLLILHENEISEKNILKSKEEINNILHDKEEATAALLQKDHEIKFISTAIENENIKSGECIHDFSSKVSSILKRFEDVNLNVEKSKKMLQDQTYMDAVILKENAILKCASKYCYEKCLAIERLLSEEKDDYLSNYSALQYNVELLECNLQSRESNLVKEREVKETAINSMELLHNNVDTQRTQSDVMQENLNNLKAEIAQAVKINDQKSHSINSLSQANLEKNNYIKNIEIAIKDLKAKLLNLTSKCKNTSDKLNKEITTLKMNVDIRNGAIKAEKAKLEQYIEKLELEEKMKFNDKKLEQEKEIEKIKESKEALSDQVKQLSIKIERSTLEVDILLRKIKPATELMGSLRTESLRKSQKFDNVKFHTKRQMDDTSDSSFDGSIPFHHRMFLKKQKKYKPQLN